MDHDLASPDQNAGWPSFVHRSDDGVNWWLPMRSGDAAADYKAGIAHFETALSMLHASLAGDFYSALGSPIALNYFCFLPRILGGMKSIGPIEAGFIDALVRKASVGSSPLAMPPEVSDFDREGERHAHFCLWAARSPGPWPEIILSELLAALDGTFECGNPRAFVWTICLAASSGGRH